MVTDLKNSLEQSRLMANLFGERAHPAHVAAELDEKIDFASKGEVVHVAAPKVVKVRGPVAVAVNGEVKRGRGRPKGSKNKNKEVPAPVAVPVHVDPPAAPIAPVEP